MKDLKLFLTFDLWLPWMIGYECSWGSQWFDLGPFTLWWSGEITSLAYEVALGLFYFVKEHFGHHIACCVDTIYFMITGESAWVCNPPQNGKSL